MPVSNHPNMSAVERHRSAGSTRRRAGLLALAVGIPALTACLSMAPAMAHSQHRHSSPQSPMYITSNPQSGATVSSAPSSVSVTFSQPLDASSKLRVIDHCGDRVDGGRPQITANQISVSIPGMAEAGKFVVLYTAVGPQGLTGATTNGFTFTATSGMACGMNMDGGKHGGMGGMGMGNGGHMGGDHSGMGSMPGSMPHGGMHMNMAPGTSTGSMHMNGMTMHSGQSMSHDAKHGMNGMQGMGGMHMGDGTRKPPPAATGLASFNLAPDGTMALVALGLAGLLGGLGGVVLRLSA